MREEDDMNRVEFMGQLERLLWDIPESDRQDAIAYYNDYFDEAGADNEAQLIQKLGSPGKVAATIKADLHTAGNEQGEYTERGYYDGGETENQNPLVKRTDEERRSKHSKRVIGTLLVILIVFASPILLGVGGGLLGGLLGLIAAVIGVVVAVAVCGIALPIAGIACIVFGIFRIAFSPAEGLATTGVGSVLLALGILVVILFVWITFKWVPALFRGCVNLCQRLFHRGERRRKE